MENEVNWFNKFKTFLDYFCHFLRDNWLPLALVLLFVIQTHLFELWLSIPVRPYFIRRSIVTAALGVILFAPAILLNRGIKYIYLIIASLFTSLILTLQFLYYSYSGGFLQASALLYAGEGLAILETVKTLLTYRLFLFFVGPLIVCAVWVMAQRGKISERILRKKEKLAASICIVLFAAAGYFYVFAREYMEAGNTVHIYQYSKLYNVNALVSKLGIVNFSLGDVLALGLHPDKVTAADINFAEEYISEQPTPKKSKDFGLVKGRNLIFIQVESLENAVIRQKIEGQEITPNINRLSREGLYFSNYYAPIGPGTTADTEFMTLNSLYSLPDTVAFVQFAYNHYYALPGLLKDNGYHTYAFHGDVPSFWNRANIYPQLGYEKWFGREDYTIPRDIGVYDLGDEDFFNQSVLKLESLPQPFMATLITLTSHTPFPMPSDLNTLTYSSTTTLNWLQQQYLQSIRYTDKAIGNFIEQLKTSGLYDNSLILIYGDHGSFSGISKALGFKNSIFSDLQPTQVPLIILVPGTSLKGDTNTPGSHMDIYPTVANLLGFNPPVSTFGHDIVGGKDAVVVSRNLISGTVTSVTTNDLAFRMAGDGIYEHGTCLKLPTKIKVSVDICRSLYISQESAVRASDLLVKGNLIKK